MSRNRQKGNSFWMLVSPAQAEAWLASSKNPRPLNRSQVELYKRQMIAGEWVRSTQGIHLNDIGLRDGFHRCTAIAESGVSVWLYVTFDCPEEGVIEFDGQLTRSTAAALNAAGEECCNSDVSVIKAMAHLPGRCDQKLSRSEVARLLSYHQEALAFVRDNSIKTKVFSAPVRAAIGRAFYHVDTERLELFCAELRCENLTGSDLDYTAPKKLVRVLLETIGGGNQLRNKRYCLTQSAIIHFIAQSKISRLLPIEDDKFPLVKEE